MFHQGPAPQQQNEEAQGLTSFSGRLMVSLTHTPIDVSLALDSVKDPSAGAVVMFAGTTRDFSGRPKRKNDESRDEDSLKRRKVAEEAESQQEYASVSKLTYSSYVPLALKTMQRIGEAALRHPWSGALDDDDSAEESPIRKIKMIHRLGEVPIMEESVVICVSAAHRQEGWKLGEWLLEEIKRKLEIWKWEEFVDGVAIQEGAGSVNEVAGDSKTNGTSMVVEESGESGTWRSNVGDDKHTEEQRRRGARTAGAPRV